MATIQRVAKNTAVTIITKTAPPLLTLVLVIFIARLAGAEELGKYTFITTVFTVFQVIGCFSFNFLLTREISRDQSNTSLYYSNSLLLGMGFSLVFFLLSLLAVKFSGYSNEIILANAIVALGLFPAFLSALNESVFMAHERNELITVITIIEHVIKVSLGIYVIIHGFGLVALAVVLSGSRLAASGISQILLSRYFFSPKLIFRMHIFKQLIKNIPTFTLIYSLAIIFLSTDVLMVSKLSGDFAVGMYSSALKLANFFKIIPESLVIVLFPLLSKFFKEQPEQFRMLSLKGFSYIMLLLLPTAFILGLFSEFLLQLAFSADYSQSSFTLKILLWTMVISAGHSYLGNILIAGNCQNKVLKTMASAVLINVLLNLLLIRKFSYHGAAFATLLASLYLLITCLYYVHRFLVNLRQLLRLVIPMGYIGVWMLVFHSNALSVTAFTLPLAMAGFFLILFIFQLIEKEDFILLKKMVQFKFNSGKIKD
jgi:O-antigen/teichoic acid export membrane protein